jgi:hypothetical protein
LACAGLAFKLIMFTCALMLIFASLTSEFVVALWTLVRRIVMKGLLYVPILRPVELESLAATVALEVVSHCDL